MPPSIISDKTFEKIRKLVVANGLLSVEDLFAGDHNNALKNTSAKHSSIQVRQPQQQQQQPQKEQYIRIFKDSTPEELWRSY